MSETVHIGATEQLLSRIDRPGIEIVPDLGVIALIATATEYGQLEGQTRILLRNQHRSDKNTNSSLVGSSDPETPLGSDFDHQHITFEVNLPPDNAVTDELLREQLIREMLLNDSNRWRTNIKEKARTVQNASGVVFLGGFATAIGTAATGVSPTATVIGTVVGGIATIPTALSRTAGKVASGAHALTEQRRITADSAIGTPLRIQI